MTTITASEVNKLRKLTGAGMMDCKKALVESNGDFDIAIDYLRKKGQKVSAKRADREANEGAIIATTSSDQTTGVIVELNCETDFVAKNEDFVSFAHALASVALENKPATIDELMALSIDGTPISTKLEEYVGKIGEKIGIGTYVILNANNVVSYIHSGNRIGVLVELNNAASEANTSAGKDVAMQIAAMNPVAVTKDEVDETTIAREIEIGKEQARAEGKPEAMLEKIAMGKLNKFFKENTLLAQPFVKDSGSTVAQMLQTTEDGLTVNSFKRIALA
jgi:elongation factor Ts